MIGIRPSTFFQMNEITYERNDKNPGLRAEVEVQPCIGLVEVASVPRGVELADGILWEAEVELLFATPVQPGKYLVLLTGSVEDVASSLRRAAELARSNAYFAAWALEADADALGVASAAARVSSSSSAITRPSGPDCRCAVIALSRSLPRVKGFTTLSKRILAKPASARMPSTRSLSANAKGPGAVG